MQERTEVLIVQSHGRLNLLMHYHKCSMMEEGGDKSPSTEECSVILHNSTCNRLFHSPFLIT